MDKIEQIKDCIERALKRESNLTPLAIDVPALSSLNIRHLMNNLGSISKFYLEIGVHRGGLFCSTVCKNGNLKMATAIDSWKSDLTGENAEIDFRNNLSLIRPECLVTAICKSDAFPDLTELPTYPYLIDLYLYDASHDEESQRMALTYWINNMADEFILCVDDYDWPEVQSGTERGISETGVEVLYSNVWTGNDHDNEGAWNGFAVFLLKKKP